jgi:hypothetical protein
MTNIAFFAPRIMTKEEAPEPPPEESVGSKTSEERRDPKSLGVASEWRQVR